MSPPVPLLSPDRLPPDWRRLGVFFGLSPGLPPILPNEPGEWRTLLADASRHGALGLLRSALKRSPGIAVPGELRPELARAEAREALWNAAVEAAEREARSALFEGGLRAVSLKGPLFAFRHYPPGAARTSHDLDFLVAQAEAGAAGEILAEVGYRPAGGMEAVRRSRLSHHRTWVRKGGPAIEMHHRLLRAFGADVPSEPFVESAVALTGPEGAEALVMSPENEAHHLLVHAAKDGFPRFSQVLDLGLFAAAHPELDWAGIAASAGRWNTRRAFDAAVRIWEAAGGAPGVLCGLPSPWSRRGLALAFRFMQGRARAERPGTAATIRAVLHEALLCDSRMNAAGLIAREGGRIAKRRAAALLPRIAPDSWRE